MAPRIRTIKPDFWISESIGTRLSGPEGRQARLLFIALWNHAEDRTGVLRGGTAFLRGAIFPYDEDVTSEDVERWLSLLESGGFIVRYERGGTRYVWVRGFVEHQRIDRPSAPTLPEPSQQEKDSSREPSDESHSQESSPRRALDEPSLQEGKGREGSGKEGILSPAVAVAAPEVDERQQVMPGFEPPPRPAEPVPESPKSPRRLSAGEELYAKIQRVRQAICEDAGESYVDDRWEFARQNKFLGPVAKGSEHEKAVFDAAFTEYVSDEAHKAKGWPLSLFMHGATRARYEKKALDALRAAS